MQKRYTLNFGAVVCVVIATYCLYALLLNSIVPFSIGSMMMRLSHWHWSQHSHIFAIGLVPVYLGLMVFGTSVVAIYVGSHLQKFVTHFFAPKPRFTTQCKNDAIHLVRKSPSQFNSKVG